MQKNKPSVNSPAVAGLRLKSGANPIWPGDCEAVKKVINDLQQRGHFVVRHTKYQIKIGDVNYYLTKGTIMLDPCNVQKEKGFDALLDVLDERAPKRPNSVRITL